MYINYDNMFHVGLECTTIVVITLTTPDIRHGKIRLESGSVKLYIYMGQVMVDIVHDKQGNIISWRRLNSLHGTKIRDRADVFGHI